MTLDADNNVHAYDRHSTVGVGFDDDLWLGEDIDLAKIPDPDRYFICVKQVGLKKKTAGGIILPDKTQDDQRWLQGVGIVCKVGKHCGKGPRFEEIGYTEEDIPQIGSLVQFEVKGARDSTIDGERYLYIPDDAIFARPAREHLKYLTLAGF